MDILVENSKSRSGKHAIRTLIFKIEKDIISQVDLPGKKVSPTYVVGDAKIVNLPNKGTFVYVHLLKNIQDRVVGKVMVYEDGRVALVMKYRKLKLKMVEGEGRYVEYVKKIFDKLKIPVKKINTNVIV